MIERAINRCKQTWPLFVVLLLLLGIIVASFEQRVALINANLPYATHMDEGYLLEPAKRLLETNDFNPHVFTYPSLPIYLISGGMALGLLKDVRNPENISNFHKEHNKTLIGRVYYPFYDLPRVVKGAKVLFAFLSVLSFIFIGLIAYKAFSQTALIFLPALFLSLSGLYLYQSWFYLNVDIIGAVTCAFFYLCLFMTMDDDTYLKRAIIPGVAAGLVIASKYTLFPIIFVTPLALVLSKCDEKVLKMAVAMGACILSFILVSPYVLLDVSTFLRHAADQVWHYQTGHAGHNVLPGWTHIMKNLVDIKNDYGALVVSLSTVGIGYAFYRHWRNTLIILSFPLLLLLYISAQKVSFTRNLTALYVLLPIFSAMGLLCVYHISGGLGARLMRRFSQEQERSKRLAFLLGSVCVLLVIYFLPMERLLKPKTSHDSRNVAATWINQNLPTGSTLIIAEALGFDHRMLRFDRVTGQSDFKVKFIDFKILRHVLRKQDNTYVLIPYYKGFLGPNGETSEQVKAVRLNKKIKLVLQGAERIQDFGVTALFLGRKTRPAWHLTAIEMPAMTRQARFSLYRLESP